MDASGGSPEFFTVELFTESVLTEPEKIDADGKWQRVCRPYQSEKIDADGKWQRVCRPHQSEMIDADGKWPIQNNP